VAYNHPDWAFPTVEVGAKQLSARELGHPLLPNERRVCNDVEIGPPGSFLLVTGSNMSGKSTLLRSIGVNALLAQAGSVVCARDMVLPPLDVETSMRVADSLADGVSFFLAELVRLKQIVDRAALDAKSERRLLYLLDEILQGTNSRERHVAVLRVIGHLLEQNAIGAVSTHDLELANASELRGACRVVHFRETLSSDAQGRKMSFDYQCIPACRPRRMPCCCWKWWAFLATRRVLDRADIAPREKYSACQPGHGRRGTQHKDVLQRKKACPQNFGRLIVMHDTQERHIFCRHPKRR
jgi:DNA mismatch repair ATPase MutS